MNASAFRDSRSRAMDVLKVLKIARVITVTINHEMYE